MSFWDANHLKDLITQRDANGFKYKVYVQTRSDRGFFYRPRFHPISNFRLGRVGLVEWQYEILWENPSIYMNASYSEHMKIIFINFAPIAEQLDRISNPQSNLRI